jgi:hypothetical protein
VATFSIWHWIIVLAIWWLIVGWPCSKILKRIGYSGWWVLLSFVPIANFVGLWILATAAWPRDAR